MLWTLSQGLLGLSGNRCVFRASVRRSESEFRSISGTGALGGRGCAPLGPDSQAGPVARALPGDTLHAGLMLGQHSGESLAHRCRGSPEGTAKLRWGSHLPQGQPGAHRARRPAVPDFVGNFVPRKQSSGRVPGLCCLPEGVLLLTPRISVSPLNKARRLPLEKQQ